MKTVLKTEERKESTLEDRHALENTLGRAGQDVEIDRDGSVKLEEVWFIFATAFATLWPSIREKLLGCQQRQAR